jgi:Zn-finger protein
LSKGKDPSTIEKKSYLVGKGFYRCVHLGCPEILSRQCWRPHIELDHLNGRKILNQHDKNAVYPCSDCSAILKSRREKELHRRKAHNLRDMFKEECRRKRELKMQEKQAHAKLVELANNQENSAARDQSPALKGFCRNEPCANCGGTVAFLMRRKRGRRPKKLQLKKSAREQRTC